MPGCSASLAAASMTGSTELGPIQPQQDSAPLLDDGLFAEEQRRDNSGRYSIRSELGYNRRKMTGGQPVQLTPLWEYAVRTRKFPKDADPVVIFNEISERLRDPEWEVRQHALRVLVDVLPTFTAENIDEIASIILLDLIDNLGNPAPAVRKGSLDTLRIYLLHSPRRDEVTRKILQEGMNRADVLDDYQTSVATGVILSTPLLLFPSRSSPRPSCEMVREATQALAMRLVQVTHQESALRSLAKIREAVGDEEFDGYLKEVDDSMKRNFELLCDVYGIRRTSSGRRKSRPRLKVSSKSADKSRRKDSLEESIRDIVAVDKSWESEDSDTSGIAEEDEDTARIGSGSSISSARVVLETEIKFNEETAITMTILEEQDKDTADAVESDDYKDEEKEIAEGGKNAEPEIEAVDEEISPDERRKTPRRVHFGGEIVKLRTPDSEDAESVMSDMQQHQQNQHYHHQQQQQQQPPPTRIPLPVSPATRLPPQQARRARSSSQPSVRKKSSRNQRRSASSSPKREVYVHNANLSPKKSILTKSSEIADRRSSPNGRSFKIEEPIVKIRSSRRDSFSPISSPRAINQEIEPRVERSFCVYDEPTVNRSPEREESSGLVKYPRVPSPNLLGESCGLEDEESKDNIDRIFGDKSGLKFQEKILKDHENMMRSVYRSKSAIEKIKKFEWYSEEEFNNHGKERRRSQSAKIPGFEVFPRQERNYILMELSSPTKDLSRRASLQEIAITEISNDDNIESADKQKDEMVEENNKETVIENVNEHKEEKNKDNLEKEDEMAKELKIDSNKIVKSDKVENEKLDVECNNEEDESEAQLDVIEDFEKSALDAKERSSDSSSDSEWKNKEPSWEELGLVDREVLDDYHNKDDWRARVRGLERIASALRTPSSLTSIEPRVGSLLHAVLGGERSCRVAAAGLAVAKIVLTGVSEDALKSRMSLIAWGLARQGGPNAAHLARLTMLRTSPGLFVEKLLQPQCIGARNAKMRENTLQLLIFSLVTFPSTEFKVKSAIEKVVAMVGDRRKRVRHSALDTLAVLSQIYESEDILEASKSYTKGKQDGQTIHAAIKTRLSRKLLPKVSVDGLVVYGLQISSNSPHTGADVEWIVAGSGSVSPGTGRTRGQLIAMSKMENDANEQNNVKTKLKSRPASEHSSTSVSVSGLLEKNDRIASWKLLPQSDQNDRHIQERRSKKLNRATKSADLSKVNKTEFEYRNEEIVEKETVHQKPYATPKRAERKSEVSNSNTNAITQIIQQSDEYSTQAKSSSAPVLDRAVSKLESRIPIYTGDRSSSTKILDTEMNNIRDRSPADASSYKSISRFDYRDNNGYLNSHKKHRHQGMKSAAPRMNYTVNYAYANNYRQPEFDKTFEEMNTELQTKFKEDFKNSPLRNFKENNQRTLSYEKLNKGFDTAVKNSRAGLRSVPHYQYSTKVTESYESIYQRQRRLKEDKSARMYETAPNPAFYAYDYDGYNANKKSQIENDKNRRNKPAADRSPQIRRPFVSPFDNYPSETSTEISDKVTADQETNSYQELNQVDSARSGRKSANFSDRVNSPRHDAEEARSNSGSSSSSNLSSTSSRRLRTRQTLPAHTESDESSGKIDENSQTSSSCVRSEDKAFDVISKKSNPSRRQSPVVSVPRNVENEDYERRTSSSEDQIDIAAVVKNPRIIDSSSDRGSFSSVDAHSDLSKTIDQSHDIHTHHTADASSDRELDENDLPPPAYNGYRSPSSGVDKSRSGSRSSSDLAFSARGSSPARSMVNANGVNDDVEDEEPFEYPEEEAAFETLDFQNATIAATNTATIVATSPVRSRISYDYDNELRNTDSNVTLYSCNSDVPSPKHSNPKRFINTDAQSKDTDSDEIPPVRIGFDSDNQIESSDGTDEVDDVGIKPQSSRLPTPIDLSRKLYKISPCKFRPQTNCNRTIPVTGSRHHDKHEKSSKAVQQCFAELDSKDWEVTLKGLRTLSQLARNDPEQLDNCAPGLVARVLGKHVKNLRSQVARVACSAAGEIFRAHIRGIDQDLDEIAAPLLHRTADTNKFLREDCNAALDSMVEHFPPNRTIITIVNRGACHQNTIVHATTARLLYVIVTEIGPDHAMILPRDVRDKLFGTTAKLLTDGNLQARKHAKETFRLLSRCEGFRKALTDAVPESTLRLIDKTLRSL